MNDKAEDLAYGRWPEILQQAGLAQSYFSGKHGPCPLCGGKDRFRWSNKYGGVWVCSNCSEGKYASGFRLLMEHLGTSQFRDAAEFVRRCFNGGSLPARAPAAASVRTKEPQADAARNLTRMERIWAAARPISTGDPVDLYLRHRVPGLPYTPRWIRFHPELDYWVAPDDPAAKPTLLGKFPAMVAKCFDPNGRFVQLHKTYLTEGGHKASVPVVKKTERGVGVNGFAVPVAPVEGDTLGFAEGIESALAASLVRRIPVWPCLNGPSMAAFDLPQKLAGQIKRVVIFADHDERKPVGRSCGGPVRFRSAGQHYAEQLARTMRARGLRVLILQASKVGHDMADYWEECQKTDAQAAV